MVTGSTPEMTLEQLLVSIGVNITSQYIYDLLSKTKNPVEVQAALANQIMVEGADVKAAQIVKFLAQNGDIDVSSSNIHSDKSVEYRAGGGSKFTLRDNTTSTTSSGTGIDIGNGASITGTGNAFIEQGEDGSITFGFGEKKPNN